MGAGNQKTIIYKKVRAIEQIRVHVKPNNPIGIYLLKVNNRNFRIGSETCSKLTIKAIIVSLLWLSVKAEMGNRGTE